MFTLPEAQTLPESLVGAESRRLGRYADLMPAVFVIPSSFEEGFYRHNNLPAQLSALFAPVKPARIDEDLLEPLCQRATALILGSALLDDNVQQLYRALQSAELSSGAVHLRRPGQRQVQQAQARAPGAEVLFALKRLWADDWAFGAVLGRLDTAGSVALEAGAVLVMRGDAGHLDADLATRLQVERAWANAYGLVGLE